MASRKDIALEFARRAKRFHANENPLEIKLWGLFQWYVISRFVKNGYVIPNEGFGKVNKVLWCKPSIQFYEKHIKPLMNMTLEEIEKVQGY